MAAPTNLNPAGSIIGPQVGASPISYPTLVPTIPVGAGIGLPAIPAPVPARVISEDTIIPFAAVLNPALAAELWTGKHKPFDVRPGGQEPLEVKSKVVSQGLATGNSPNAWKSKPFAAMANAILFGIGKAVQKPVKVPWNKKFIPPLALFNDASQWVNRLMFNQPMTPWDSAVSADIALKAQYFTPPPLNTSNLAAGTLNLQLQLGNIRIQAQQLTLSASNYFGG